MKIKLIDFGMQQKPQRSHYNDAGADVRVVFHDNTKLEGILPHTTKRFPLGFGHEIPDGYMGLLLPRSGLASKGITCEIPPIDSGYRGEICALITNNNDESVLIESGERIAQLVIVPCVIADFVEDTGDERGTGGFGSTGVN